MAVFIKVNIWSNAEIEIKSQKNKIESVKQSCGDSTKKKIIQWGDKNKTKTQYPANIIKSIQLLDTRWLWPCITAKNAVKKPSQLVANEEEYEKGFK